MSPDVRDEACGWAVLVGPPPAGPAFLDEVPRCAVVVEPIAATPGPVECPPPQADKPHAASPRAATATAVSLPRCQYVVALPRLPGPFARLIFSVVLSTITVVAFPSRAFERSWGPSEAIVRDGRSHRGHTCDLRVTCDLRCCA